MRCFKRYLLVVGPLSVLFLASVPVEAFRIPVSDDFTLTSDVTLTYGAAWRTEKPDDFHLANINADDGDRNFKQWDMINNRFSISIDFDANYKRNFGVFVRPRAYYDFAYTGHNANDSPRTNNNGPANGGPLAGNNDFMHETIELHGRKSEILDAYAYSKFDIGGHKAILRVGRQAVSWGESLFLLGGVSSAQSPVDATQANVPGVEIKDILLPVGQVYSSLEVGGGVTLAGYYQWEWDKTRLDEAGAFFSVRGTGDIAVDAGRRVLIPTPAALAAFPFPTVDRTSNEEPKDSGQYGIALRYVANWLNNTEFGLYYVNYHDKLPQAIWSPTGGYPTPGFPNLGNILNVLDNTSYHFKWQENIHLYGASFSTLIGTANVAGEVSYRKGFPVQVKDPANPVFRFSYREADVLQAQLSTIYVAGASPLWNNLTVTAEAGFNRVNGLGEELFWNKTAWGFTARTAFDYFQVLKGLDLQIPVTYKANFHNSAVIGTFTDRADSVSVSTDFTYLADYKFSVGYIAFINSPGKNPRSDRDILTASLKYTF